MVIFQDYHIKNIFSLYYFLKEPKIVIKDISKLVSVSIHLLLSNSINTEKHLATQHATFLNILPAYLFGVFSNTPT